MKTDIECWIAEILSNVERGRFVVFDVFRFSLPRIEVFILFRDSACRSAN